MVHGITGTGERFGGGAVTREVSSPTRPAIPARLALVPPLELDLALPPLSAPDWDDEGPTVLDPGPFAPAPLAPAPALYRGDFDAALAYAERHHKRTRPTEDLLPPMPAPVAAPPRRRPTLWVLPRRSPRRVLRWAVAVALAVVVGAVVGWTLQALHTPPDPTAEWLRP